MDKNAVCFVTGGSGYIGRNLLRRLQKEGCKANALVRSEASAEVVRALGATPVMGDITTPTPLNDAMQGADLLFHLAADTSHGRVTPLQQKANQEGTRAVFAAAKAAGVSRALHLSTEAVLLSGAPLKNANETKPYPDKFAGGYSKSKALAEQAALASMETGFEVVVMRPRFVWGGDDTTALPALIEAAQSGKLAWIDGGQYLTSTTHIENVVHGMVLTMEKGRAGEVYFITDGAALPFRDFVSRLLATQKIDVPQKQVPRWLVRTAVELGELASGLTGGRLSGPMSKQEYATLGVEVSLDIAKARKDLGYAPVVSVDEGMDALVIN